MKKAIFVLGGALAVVGIIFLFAFSAPLSHAQTAGAGCTSSAQCGSSGDICYFPGTNQSYCALPIGGSGSCNYGCCSNSQCGGGQTCYNAGTPTAYCALPASCTSSANCGTGDSCVNGQCVVGGTVNAGTSATTPPTNIGLGGITNPAPTTPTQSGTALCITAAPAISTEFDTQEADACQQLYSTQEAQCVASGANTCSYTNPSLAFNCGMPRSSLVGYCLPGENSSTTGCVQVLSPTQIDQQLGNVTCPSSGATGLGGITSGGGSTLNVPAEISSLFPEFTRQYAELPLGNIGITQSYSGLPGASSSSPARPLTPTLLIDNVTSNSYAIGSSWTLTLATNIPNASFTLCALVNGTQSCTPNWGTTDANGNWTQSGSFPSGTTLGSWIEWVEFPNNGNVSSNQIVFNLGAAGTTSGASTGAGINFPATILVTASALNVRAMPNTSASLAGSQTLYAGDTFVATNEVVGESVDGNDLWWVSSLGNYVWSGGTTAESSNGTTSGTSGFTAQGRTSNPSITSAAYSATEGLLVIDGNFNSSGNTVFVNGTQLSNSGDDQTANSLQMEIDQSNNGSVYNAVTSGSYTVSVQDSQGTSQTFTVSPANGIVLNSTQGYNPTSKVYESTSNVLNPGDTYIVLYGSFPSSDNGVTLQWGTGSSAIVPANQITFQGTAQINVSLGTLIPAGVSSFSATVYNLGSSAKSNAVTVADNGGGSESLTQSAVLTKIQSASSLAQAVSFAKEAAFTVTPWSGVDAQGVTISDPKTGNILATVTEWDDMQIPSAPSTSLTSPLSNLAELSTSISTPAIALISHQDITILNDFISTAVAAGTQATAVGNSTGQTATCAVAGTNGAANVLVFPNGQIYGGGASSYSFTSQLGGLTGGQAMITSAQNFIDGLGAAQLSDNTASNNNIAVNVYNDIAPGDAGVALAVSTMQPSGTFLNSCDAAIGANNLADLSNVNIAPGNSQYTQAVTNIIIHEILHCMGLGHSTNPLDIMAGTTNNTAASAYQWATNQPSIDPSEINTLKQIASGQTIQVEDCNTECLEGQGFSESNLLNPGQGGECVEMSDLCTNSSDLWDDQTQSCMTCQQLGYPNGWIADQYYGICGLEVNGGQAPEVPLEPSISSEPACYCTSAGAVCLDENGNVVATTEGFSCPSVAVPDGEVCTCAFGQASCSMNGSSVAVPSDFSCSSDESSSGSPSSDDNAYAQYTCISSACTYIGQGPDYSDPTCGGGCDGN